MAKKHDKKKKRTLAGNILIRPLTSWHEMSALEALQQVEMPGGTAHIVHAPMLASVAHNGGLVLGAFDGDTLVGGSVSFLGAASDDANRPAMANLKLHSRDVLVREPYRGQGIGYHLKLAEYQFAQQRGIRLVTWLFDPLSSVNAHMGLRKLGVVVSQYFHDFFGEALDGVRGATDRFQADWWLTSWRVAQRLGGKRGDLSLDQYLDGGTRILNPTKVNAMSLPVPSEDFILPPGALGLIEIPPRYERIESVDDGLAAAWRAHVRALFVTVLSSGFVLTDFVHEPYEGRQRSFYVCSHEGALRQFDQRFNQN